MSEYKLVTVSNYASMVGKTRQAIHYQIRQGALSVAKIDGKIFVKVKKDL